MFRLTLTQEFVRETTATESHAITLLRRTVRRGYDVEAATDGSVAVNWTYRRFHPRDENRTLTEPRSLTLTPQILIRGLTEATRRDLELIQEAGRRARFESQSGRQVVTTGFHRIPPAASARLHERGFITDDHGRARLTLPALIAMHAQDHRTHTTTPQGWARPSDAGHAGAGLNRPGRRNGLLYNGTSAALCRCGALNVHADTRDEARRRARDHQRTATAQFIREALTT
ncbi:hypothetical protein OG321_42255 [Streptomyces sp. NBC_00424]|uniref:hypothetical protein n=1 Tax=Streptomyces sp. NBC_00424 TaxID=2903648 RepID=UPI002259B4A5|nr:hypothetical protein [Streptomyces sp. NBC_00424]MCX5079021.1 hypothetical protein [Streptomyces sp. NBC_00424]